MTVARRAPRRDRNEPAIIRALRATGASVCQINETGAPDLIVGYEGRNFLLEGKSQPGPRGGLRGQLTSDQCRWILRWRGQVQVVTTVDEAIEALGL